MIFFDNKIENPAQIRKLCKCPFLDTQLESTNYLKRLMNIKYLKLSGQYDMCPPPTLPIIADKLYQNMKNNEHPFYFDGTTDQKLVSNGSSRRPSSTSSIWSLEIIQSVFNIPTHRTNKSQSISLCRHMPRPTAKFCYRISSLFDKPVPERP